MAEKESHITSSPPTSPVVASAIPRYLRRKPSFEDTNAVYPSSPLVSPPLEGCNGPNRARSPSLLARDGLRSPAAGAGSSTRSLPSMGGTLSSSQISAHARQACTEQDVQRLRDDVSALKTRMRQMDERLDKAEEILREHQAQKEHKRSFFWSPSSRRR